MMPTVERVRFINKVFVENEWKSELRPEKRNGLEFEVEALADQIGLTVIRTEQGGARTRRVYRFPFSNVAELAFKAEPISTEKVAPEQAKAPKKN